MARATTKFCLKLLESHDGMRDYILKNPSLSNREKSLQLQAINSLVSQALMDSNCYHGFQILNHEAWGAIYKAYEDNTDPNKDYGLLVLDTLENNTIHYYRSYKK